MRIKTTVLWTCTIVISLFIESYHAQKINVHWGPQSMMYLKGKHGRRYVSENDDGVFKQGLKGWYAAVRGFKALRSMEISKPSRILSSEKFLIQYLQ